jgi:hypothetical protein
MIVSRIFLPKAMAPSVFTCAAKLAAIVRQRLEMAVAIKALVAAIVMGDVESSD